MHAMQKNEMQQWGITVIRVIVGATLAAHGGQKLFVMGLGNLAQGFGNNGFPLPMVSAALCVFAEFGCGLALVLGFMTRYAAVPLVINMAVAVFAVHLKGGFFLPKGCEYALLLLCANVALVLTGSGRLALDEVIFGRTAD